MTTWDVLDFVAAALRLLGFYQKRMIPLRAVALGSNVAAVDPVGKMGIFARSSLQDLLTAQGAVLIGLIAHLVGTPLQDDVVRATDRLLRLGQDILAMARGPPTPPP